MHPLHLTRGSLVFLVTNAHGVLHTVSAVLVGCISLEIHIREDRERPGTKDYSSDDYTTELSPVISSSPILIFNC